MSEGVTVNWQTLITVAAIITALGVILKNYNHFYDMIKHQDEQDKQIKQLREDTNKRSEETNTRIDNLRDENTVILKVLDGVLSGLIELGCNGEVHRSREELQNYLRESRK